MYTVYSYIGILGKEKKMENIDLDIWFMWFSKTSKLDLILKV